jgi:hypothetical protein
MSQRNASHSSSKVWSMGLTPLNMKATHYLQTSGNTHPAMHCHIPEDQNHPHENFYDELCNNILQYGGDNYQAKNVTLTVLFLNLAVEENC